MNKGAIISLIAGTILIGGSLWYSSLPKDNLPDTAKITDGKQIIEILVRGGYIPNSIKAKAGVETIIKFRTENTFDCSAALVIPKLNYEKMLKSTGIEEVLITPERATGTITGSCGMGMYGFKIAFE